MGQLCLNICQFLFLLLFPGLDPGNSFMLKLIQILGYSGTWREPLFPIKMCLALVYKVLEASFPNPYNIEFEWGSRLLSLIVQI